MKYESNDRIRQVVVNACLALEEDRRKLEKERKSQGLIVNQFLSGLIAGIGSEEFVEKECELLGLSFCGVMFGIAVIGLDSGMDRYLKPNKPEDLELLLFSIKNVCNEVLGTTVMDDYQVCIVHYNHRINLLFNFAHEDLEKMKKDTEHISQTMVGLIDQYLKIQVRMGIGSFGKGFNHIAFSYEEAMIAAQLKDSTITENILFYDQVKYSGNSHQAFLKTIMDYITNNYDNVDLDLKIVAETVHISPSYVSTLFKRYTDVNFSDYVLRIRMEKAIELLIHTDYKVYEVAEKVGFINTQYFSVQFKRQTGLSPIEFRQQNRQ
ncbi:helix-turn-helix domain-containing protein [Paenibacillus hexagrammi]|uniref:AraC family transcriptional regulator n=1 Tax=Paenibacillus hexagrammi TaxID=2908839 RepID=A0ABY3SCK2_9BACL|nr:AraC family transcriptional regulator [Paenibacillus sp. YPD9-1]UJF31729.1 AraC family transcriptional regulator [Paenibacillus sp. YPD9-1]